MDNSSKEIGNNRVEERKQTEKVLLDCVVLARSSLYEPGVFQLSAGSKREGVVLFSVLQRDGADGRFDGFNLAVQSSDVPSGL